MPSQGHSGCSTWAKNSLSSVSEAWLAIITASMRMYRWRASDAAVASHRSERRLRSCGQPRTAAASCSSLPAISDSDSIRILMNSAGSAV